MALGNWKDRIDGVSYVLADDINSIARAVLDIEENGAKPKDGTVKTKSIEDGAVTSEKIEEGGVTSIKIADKSVIPSKLSNNMDFNSTESSRRVFTFRDGDLRVATNEVSVGEPVLYGKVGSDKIKYKTDLPGSIVNRERAPTSSDSEYPEGTLWIVSKEGNPGKLYQCESKPATGYAEWTLFGDVTPNAVRYTKQTLTDEQKAQARENIGAENLTVKSVTESTEDGGDNVVEFSDGSTLTVKNGNKGDPYLLTEADRAEIAENVKGECIAKNQGASNVGKILVVGTDGNLVLADMPEGASGDVIGTLDDANNILLSGNLADGTYTLKYENADGTYTEIGTLTVTEIAVEPTNLADPTSADWLVGARYSVSSQAITSTSTANTTHVTNYIPVKKGDAIHFDSNVYFSSNEYGQFAGDANKNKLLIASVGNGGSYWSFENNVITILHDDVKFMRFTLVNVTDKNAVIITKV
jgi:hypothetical protein